MPRLIAQLVSIFFFVFVLSCNKPPDQQPPAPPTSPDYTIPPPATPVSSKLMVYAIGNSQASYPYYVQTSTSNLNYSTTYNGFHTSGTVALDRYTSVISARPSLTADYKGYLPQKTFTASDAIKNYVNVKPLALANAGYVVYDYGSATLSLPNSGQLVLPPYSFGTHSGPVSFEVWAGFSRPSMTDYAVNLPCYPMEDENGKRYFLNSYGVYLLSPRASDDLRWDTDFSTNVNVVLRLAIPPNQQTLPDSIPVWNINNKNQWQRNGYALRSGNYYEKKITKKGYWNFAIPVSGVYTTFRLKAYNGIDLANVRYVIKNGSEEVAEGRTAANGEGIVFVPTNKDLVIDLINDHPLANNVKIQNLFFGNFNKASTINISLPSRKDFVTLKGNVLDCDGKVLTNGYIGFRANSSNDEYLAPITNGKFSIGQWIAGLGFIPSKVVIYNNAGDSLFGQPFVVSSPFDTNHNYNANFYPCSNTSQLYCNYRIDTTEYSMVGNVSSATPELYSKTEANDKTRISLMNNGKGLRFNAITGTITTGISLLNIDDMEVNGTPVKMYFPTGSGQNYLYFYRNDSASGGFREGWFWIYYKDSAGTIHTVTGNFRIKIL